MKQKLSSFCSASVLTFLILFVFTAFCVAGENTGVIQPLAYGVKSLEKIHVEQGKDSVSKSYCRCRYPVFSAGGSAAAINAALHGWIADSTAIAPGKEYTGDRSIESLAANFLQDYEKYRKDFPVNWPYEFELDGSVLFNRSGVLAVGLSCYSFTGGAHGNSHTEYFVFDVRTGRRLGLRDVFIEGFEETLNKLIDRRFRQMKGLSPEDRLDNAKGTLFENYIHFNRNFAFTDKGVSFYYNQYEIAAYAYGPTIIDLTYHELQEILKQEFREL
ncbi:MAG: DUF3298 and DUF4163 domain-containing protein [Chlorobium sp.]|nr:MAG: DUF3298 and DUF4163 domain-containing protein [Chlorobium sp.]